jgi:hypothetical protein
VGDSRCEVSHHLTYMSPGRLTMLGAHKYPSSVGDIQTGFRAKADNVSYGRRFARVYHAVREHERPSGFRGLFVTLPLFTPMNIEEIRDLRSIRDQHDPPHSPRLHRLVHLLLEQVPQWQPKRGRLRLNDGSCIRLRPTQKDHVWSYEFVQARTRDGRAFRMLTLIDELTRDRPDLARGRGEVGAATKPRRSAQSRPALVRGEDEHGAQARISPSRRRWPVRVRRPFQA